MLSHIRYSNTHDARVQAVHAIIKRAAERRITLSKRWSWVELLTDNADYEWLRAWAMQLESFDLQAVGNMLPHEQVPASGTPWAGLFTRSNVLMLPLVGLFAEILRREEQDNEVWPRLLARMEWPSGLRQMVASGPARQDLCDAMRVLATSMRMRHVYDLPLESAFRRHYHFLWLQAGAGLGWRGDQCLADWLVGFNLPDRIEMLRGTLHGDANRSEEFLKAWDCLRTVRRGNITDEAARKRLGESCWFVGDPSEMVAAARRSPHAYDVDARAASIAATFDDDDPSAEEDAPSYFGRPVWRWEQGIGPVVELEMQNLTALASPAKNGSLEAGCDYFVWLPGDERCAVKLLNQSGSFAVLGEAELRVRCTPKHLSPELVIRIGDQHGRLASWEAIRLWDPAQVAVLVDLADGSVSGAGKQLEAGSPFLLIVQRDLIIEPNPDEHIQIAEGDWVLCRFASMPPEGVVVREGEEEVWSMRSGAQVSALATESLVRVESYEMERSQPAEPGGKVRLRVTAQPGLLLQSVTHGSTLVSVETNGTFGARVPVTEVPRTLQIHVQVSRSGRGRTIRATVPVRVRGCVQMSGTPHVLRATPLLNSDSLAGEPLFLRMRLSREREQGVVEDEARTRVQRERRHASTDDDVFKRFEAESERLRQSLIRDLEPKVANIVQRRTLLMEGTYGHSLLSTTLPVRGPLLGLGENLSVVYGPLNPQAADKFLIARAVISTGCCEPEPLEADQETLRIKLAGVSVCEAETAKHYSLAVLAEDGRIVERPVRFVRDNDWHAVESDLPTGMFPAQVVAAAVLYHSSVIGTAWRKDWVYAMEAIAESTETRRVIDFIRLFRLPILQREAKQIMERVFAREPLVWFEVCLAPGECRICIGSGNELWGRRPLENERWRYALAELSAAWRPTDKDSEQLIKQLEAGARPLARAAEQLLEIEPKLAGAVFERYLPRCSHSARSILWQEMFEKTESQMGTDHTHLRWAAAERVREITGADDGDSILHGLLALLRGNGDEQGDFGRHNWSVLARDRDVGRFLFAAKVFGIGF